MRPYLLDFFWFTLLVRAFSNSFVLDKLLAEAELSDDLDAVDLDAMMVRNRGWGTQ